MAETFEAAARRSLKAATRNRHIPQDIWDAATAAVHATKALAEDVDNDTLPLEIEIIAKALLAEREACAEAACPPNKVFGHSGGMAALDGYISGRVDAAAAIRNRDADGFEVWSLRTIKP